MAYFGEKFVHVKIHEFKSNISKFIAFVENGYYEGLIIKRHNNPVGFFIPINYAENSKPKKSGNFEGKNNKFKNKNRGKNINKKKGFKRRNKFKNKK